MGGWDLGLGDSMESDRTAENKDSENLKTIRDDTSKTGLAEMDKYEDPEINQAQEERLHKYETGMDAQTKALYSHTGSEGSGPGSSAELAAMKAWSTEVALMRYDMKETIKEQSWNRALQSLGLSASAAAVLTKMHKNDRDSTISIYSSLMGAAGSLISKVGAS